MNFLDRLKLILDEKNMTFAELERIAGFGNGTIRRWSNNSPSVEKVLSVANLLDIDINWLLTGKNSLPKNSFLEKYNLLSDKDKEKINIFIEISLLNTKKEVLYSHKNIKENPLIKETSEYKLKKRVYNYRFYKPSSERSKTENTPYIGTVAAGTPNLSYYEGAYEYIHSPVKCDFAMRANGDSMYPVINDNDYIFVKSTPFIDIGDIGIISIDGETTCKKFYFEDNKMILKSFNPDFEPIIYEIKESLKIKILGKVILTPEQEKNL